MYLATGVIIIIYIILFFLSKEERKGKAPPGIMGIFYPMAVCIYKSAYKIKLPMVSSVQVREDLKCLYPGGDGEQLSQDYYVKKISLSLLLCITGTLLGVAITYSEECGKQLKAGAVSRGTYADETKEIEITARLPHGTKKQFHVTVHPQELLLEEAEKIYWEFAQELPELILGDNTSLRQVTGKLALEEGYEGFPFEVEWKSNRPDVLSRLGNIYPVEEAVKIVLSATVTYEEYEWCEDLDVTVIPPVLSEEEIITQEIENLLKSSEDESRVLDEWVLPAEYGGQVLVWDEVVQRSGHIFLGGALVVAVLVFLLADKDLHDELIKKRESIKRAYPDVVQKLLLYLGAGLTIRASFQKMASEYEQEYKEGMEMRSSYCVYRWYRKNHTVESFCQ